MLSETAATAAVPHGETPPTRKSPSLLSDNLTTAAARNPTAYRIGPQDVIDVSVFLVPELSKTMQVSDAGTTNLPLIGEISIAGKTGREVEQEFTRILKAKYLQHPQVTIFIKEYNSQKITIEGAVRRPGVVPIRGGMSLLQAVAIAQGMEDVSDDTVIIFRDANGKRNAARFDISEIRAGTAPDPQLAAGDVVVAGASVIKKSFNGFMKILPVSGLFTLL